MGNWEPVIPYIYRRGALIELDSDDCACILWVNLDPNVDYICDDCPPPTGISKYVATTTAGRTVSAACDSSYVIHEGEIRNKSISSITIGNCVTSLDTYALKSYDNLVTATIPSNVSYIGWGVFNNCDNLVTVNLNASIDRIPVNAFSYCPNLQNITIPGSVIIIDDSSFLWCVSLPSITIPDSVRIIGNGAFDLCSGLTSVTIGNSVTNIGEHAFGNCSGLTSVVIPNSTKYIGDNAFVGCSGLTNLTFGNSVEFIGTGAFADCTSLTGSITLPSTLQHLGCGVFNNCSGLTSVTVEAVVPPEMQHYPPAFENTNDCPIYVPCNSVDAYKHADGWYFYSSRIEAIPGSCVTPKWIATYTGGTTSSAACDSATTIYEGDITLTDLVSVEIGDCITSINNWVFGYCSSLTSVTIPDSVTSIGNDVFFNCTGLTSVTIPSGVTYIGRECFYRCSRLQSVTVLATTPPSISTDVFYNTNNCPIYVPSGSVDAYKTANRWSDYASRIQAIP